MTASESFDEPRFAASLAAGDNPLTVYKEALRQAGESFDERFRDGEPVAALVTERAEVIDALLVRAWCDRLGEFAGQMALVAVGGYGRGELHPRSDIDIMILADEASLTAAKASLEAFLLFLWDIGLEVGQSVRTIADCVEQSLADITVITNLMESRLLYGDADLYARMRAAVGTDRLWPSAEFFRAKWEEQIERHRKFHDTAYNLEPNVKEGPGGLRDIQMIGWVAKRHFDAETLRDLVYHGFLTEEEYQALHAGQLFLWRVRYGLHLLTGRREDRLLIDQQRALAKLFGYADEPHRLAVELFMKDYYRTVMELERLNEMLLQLFQEELLYADEPEEVVPLGKRFQARRGFLEVTHPRVYARYPYALLETFLVLAQQPQLKGIRAGTIRLLRQNRHRIDEAFRADLRSRSLFIELLRQPQGVTIALRAMNRHGILAAYLPAFGKVVGQMQHDLFHVYTVDEHTLRVVRNMRRFAIPSHYHEFPLCSRVMQSLPKPELLYIAGLFHDIAKGRGGDHSQLGAEDAREFCHSHGLGDYDTHLVTWIVRNHLMMSTTAQRMDISDPDVVNRFANDVGNTTYLDYLYLMTVADVRATSPSVWNSWKDALLAELYHATHGALRRGLANPLLQDELIVERKVEASKLLRLQRIEPHLAEALWQRLDEDYFVRYSADEIAWHTQAIIRHHNPQVPLILLRQQTERGGTEIFVYTPIRHHQFSITTAVLDQLGLNIVDARIIPSKDHYTLDTYIVLESDGEPIRGQFRLEEIEQNLERYLTENQTPPQVKRHTARQLKHFSIPTQVVFHEDPRNACTIVEVVTTDQPGVLSHIAAALAHCGVRLLTAKIATFGERVEDIFFITGQDHQALHDPVSFDCLRRTITERLES